MIKRIALFAILVISATSLSAQGIDFFKGTWEEALAKAEKEQKIIFMDAYAEWCGPCKRMAKTVFTDSQVGEFYNRTFINVKMDMEKGEGVALQRKYGVRAFPTLLYIDYDGSVVKRSVGAKQSDGFIELGKEALSSIDRTGLYAEKYEKGDRSPDLIYNYIVALNQVGQSSLKIANDYLRDQDNLSSPENLKIIFAAATEIDSRIFKLMMENRPAIETLFSAKAVQDRILLASQNTMLKALEFNSDMLVDEAKSKIGEYHPDIEDAFAAKADMAIATRRKDEGAYEKALKDYMKKGAEQDPAPEVSTVVSEALELYSKNDKVVDYCTELLEMNAKRTQLSRYYLEYARILAFSDEKKQAVKAAEKAVELAKKEGGPAQLKSAKFLKMLQEERQG